MMRDYVWPVGEIEELGLQLPPGIYAVTMGEITDRLLDDGRVLLEVQLTVEMPVEHKGMRLRDVFYIGTDADKDGRDPETWKKLGGKRLKNMLVSAGVAENISVPFMCLQAEGKTVLANVVLKPSQKDPSVMFSNVTRYFVQGTKTIGVGSSVGKVGANGEMAKQYVNRTAPPPPPAPSVMSEGEEE